MGDYIAIAGFDGRALLLLLIGGCVFVGGARLLVRSDVPKRYLENIDPGPRPLAVRRDVIPAGSVLELKVPWVDPARQDLEDAELDPSLLVLESDVVELLRDVREVDPPLYVWDRIEAAMNRRPPASLDEEWERVQFAVIAARCDFGGHA